MENSTDMFIDQQRKRHKHQREAETTKRKVDKSPDGEPAVHSKKLEDSPDNIADHKRKRSRHELSAEKKKFKVDKSAEADEAEYEKHVNLLAKYRTYVPEVAPEIEQKDGTDEHEITIRDQKAVQTAGLVPFPQPQQLAPISAVVAKDAWITKPVYVKATTTRPFNTLHLSNQVLQNIQEMGFQKAFAVQCAVVPLLMADMAQIGPDLKPSLLVNSSTGSGKTLAYGIPIVEALFKRVVPRIRAVVVLPTRPLTQQVRNVLELLARGTSLRIMSLRSDRAINEERQLLESSTPDIIVTTPGRLVDHIQSTKGFTLQHLRYLVIDEADRLLNQSFHEWVDLVIGALDERKLDFDSLTAFSYTNHVQKLIFSATLTNDAGKWASLYIKQPRLIIVGDKSKDVSDKEDFAVPFTLSEYTVEYEDSASKPLLLLNLLWHEEISGQCIIFARSNETAARLAKVLTILEKELRISSNGVPYRIGIATGEVKQNIRRRTLRELALGDLDLLICTDIIARGIDIESITHVINYDVPIGAREYVHRVGRTARAGKPGTALSLISRQEAKWFKQTVAQIKRGKDQKLRRRKVEVPEEQFLVYESALRELEREVKHVPT
ncbi:P-loop containing nucleoside triphosphate hydrolase protein [Limtongia smithiae]|uniref:P-loop containing nucleoside triphosphate hydrolase protein n=1 Tax=Limtongia smithiae TaxID=1125753 RepID=UPI0034CEB866